METTSEKQGLGMQYTNDSEPMVVIEMITYNHEKYIAQAIESILMQKTNFNYKIIICEDCSTDNTAQICAEYKNKHPKKIELHLNSANVGVYLNAKKLHELSRNSNAKYIAMLDGDDYWTNAFKLQKQVDFLELNKDYAFCFHRVDEDCEGKIGPSYVVIEKESTFTINDLANGNFIHTSSVIYRHELNTLPDWFSDAPAADYVLYMLSARHGKIKYFPDLMAIYRRHNQGIWSSLTEQARTKNWLRVLSLLLREDFGEEVTTILRKQWRNNANNYLHTLFPTELETFTKELKIFAKEDPMLAYEWATEIYPNYIKNITSSRAYKIAKKASHIKNSLK
jgi:glycosyltransferase involved in cell wall biosynthesis